MRSSDADVGKRFRATEDELRVSFRRPAGRVGTAGCVERVARSPELMRMPLLALRYAWASPATVVGLLVCGIALCAGGTIRFVDGVLEVAGGRVDRLASLLSPSARFVAITFGHVIVGIDHVSLRCVRSHEHVHVRQYERWGVLFFPLYLASSLAQLLRGRDPYLNNCFEREAYARPAGTDEA